jgi:hypothetical protein
MRRRGLAVLLATTITMNGLPALAGIAHARAKPLHYEGPFVAQIYRGPDSGLRVAGALTLSISRSSGHATGTVVRVSGSVVRVQGRVRGGAINLAFNLGGGKYLFAVGAAFPEPRLHKVVMGGPLVGPRRADSGDWQSTGQPAGSITSG